MFTEHLDFIYKKSSTTRFDSDIRTGRCDFKSSINLKMQVNTNDDKYIHKEMFDCVSDILKHQNEQSKLPLFTPPCILPLYVNFEAISMLCIIF